MITKDMFEEYTPQDAYDRFYWGDLADDGTMVYALQRGEVSIFVDVYDGQWACEVLDPMCLLGQGFADTFEDAVAAALVDAYGVDEMEAEDNCEDAVNAVAYTAYFELFGVENVTEVKDFEALDTMLGAARSFVKSRIARVDYEWEEF